MYHVQIVFIGALTLTFVSFSLIPFGFIDRLTPSRLLKELNAFFCDRLGNSSICSLGRHCGELEKINIVYSDVSDDAITSLAEGCPRLLDLNVAFCDTITDTSMAVETAVRTAIWAIVCRHGHLNKE